MSESPQTAVSAEGAPAGATVEDCAALAVQSQAALLPDKTEFRFVHLATTFAAQEAWRAYPTLHGFCVFYAGWYVEAQGHFWKRDNTNEGIYIYCTGGKGFYRCNGQEWPVRPGDLVYCAPFTNHSYGADADDPWTIYWMHVSGPEISTYSSMLRVSIDLPVIHVGHHPRAIETFQTLFQFLKPPLTLARMAGLSGAGRLLLASFAVNEELPEEKSCIAVEIQRLMAIMEEHVYERGSIEEWVKIAGTSRSQFHRQFKRITGQTPYCYFLRLKIQKACSLLVGSSMRIGKIGRQLGIPDPLYFSRLFHRVTGYTARDYRKLAHQEKLGVNLPNAAQTSAQT